MADSFIYWDDSESELAGAGAAAFLTLMGLDNDLLSFSLPASTTISTFGASIIDDANAAAVLATLSLDADLATFSLPASTTISAFGSTLIDDTTTVTANATLGLTSIIAGSHTSTTVISPLAIALQSLRLINDTGATVTEIDTGALANLDTVVPTSKAVTTAIAAGGGGSLVLGNGPIASSGTTTVQLYMVNDADATVTEIDTGALANSDTVIPTSKAVTTAIAGLGGSGHVIQNSSTTFTNRANLQFTGAGVTVTDSSVNTATVVNIPAGGGGGGDFLVMQVFS